MFDGYLPEWFVDEENVIDFLNTYKQIIIKESEYNAQKKIENKIDKTYTPKVIDL